MSPKNTHRGINFLSLKRTIPEHTETLKNQCPAVLTPEAGSRVSGLPASKKPLRYVGRAREFCLWSECTANTRVWGTLAQPKCPSRSRVTQRVRAPAAPIPGRPCGAGPGGPGSTVRGSTVRCGAVRYGAGSAARYGAVRCGAARCGQCITARCAADAPRASARVPQCVTSPCGRRPHARAAGARPAGAPRRQRLLLTERPRGAAALTAPRGSVAFPVVRPSPHRRSRVVPADGCWALGLQDWARLAEGTF